MQIPMNQVHPRKDWLDQSTAFQSVVVIVAIAVVAAVSETVDPVIWDCRRWVDERRYYAKPKAISSCCRRRTRTALYVARSAHKPDAPRHT